MNGRKNINSNLETENEVCDTATRLRRRKWNGGGLEGCRPEELQHLWTERWVIDMALLLGYPYSSRSAGAL